MRRRNALRFSALRDLPGRLPLFAMLRLVEVLLFLSPFAAFALWRLLAPVGGPSPRVIGAAAGVVVLLLGLLLWYRTQDALPPGSTYVPPEFHDGRIVPGHAGSP